MNRLNIIILAAGQGTRMKSARPKVLHTLAHKSLLAHVLDSAETLQPQALFVVHGHGGGQVREAFAGRNINWVAQTQQLGTGHAVQQAMPAIDDRAQVLILYGDVPLLQTKTLRALTDGASDCLHLLTAQLDDPRGYGRIVRDANGRVQEIVEEKDADPAARAIKEINTGIMCVPARHLRTWLANLTTNNAQGEYYLTDIIVQAVAAQEPIETLHAADPYEIMGVNDFVQLAELERYYQRRMSETLMRQGVHLRDPARFDVRGEIKHGANVEIDINVVLEGKIRLGERVRIGPGCLIRDAVIGDDVEILAHSVIENTVIGSHSRIGPFARLRPDTVLAEHVHIGNFVEVKKSQVGTGSKINHLSYIGDSKIGSAVNIGAGTITCNYDGANKHKTHIGDRVFIGSASQLVAPITVGDGATIGAGTTLTRDAPPEQLTLSRAPQITIPDWTRPHKGKK
jgi:bifunctional UDP-N-acetylglucosamine pyrophosphorylase / glucosamine-1-phosphate N-acetyltransferase